MIKGLVSTIIPVYNRPAQLRESVASVINQDYRPIEIVIVNDGSTDGDTLCVANELSAAYPDVVSVVTQVNGGPGVARECGRQRARGEFIQYLDSDDFLYPVKFSVQVAALRADPDADVAYGISYARDVAGQVHAQPMRDTGVVKATMFPSFLNSRWWVTSTPLYRAKTCERAGPWTDLRLEEDWEYDCRIAALGGRLAYCDAVVSEHRDHAGARLCRGSSRDPIRMAMRARSHQLIWQHAKQAGLPSLAPAEVSLFSRSLFLLSRQCGAAGLERESRELFVQAREAGGKAAESLDFRFYRVLATAVGWVNAGRMSEWLDRLRFS